MRLNRYAQKNDSIPTVSSKYFSIWPQFLFELRLWQYEVFVQNHEGSWFHTKWMWVEIIVYVQYVQWAGNQSRLPKDKLQLTRAPNEVKRYRKCMDSCIIYYFYNTIFIYSIIFFLHLVNVFGFEYVCGLMVSGCAIMKVYSCFKMYFIEFIFNGSCPLKQASHQQLD